MSDKTVEDIATDDRPVWPSLRRGWSRKCPNCGSGSLFNGYLKVKNSCEVCDQELYHHRADDGPAHLTILTVGLIMAPTLLITYEIWRPEPLTLFTIFGVGSIALSLYLLPRLKGAIVAYQWSRRLNGFGKPA